MSEPVEVQCPSCQKKLRVPAEAAGKRVRCPACQTVISVPAAGFTASPPPPSPPPSPVEPEDDGGRRRRPRDDDDDAPPARRRDRDDRDDDRDDDYDDEGDRPIRKRYEGGGLTAAAICMMIVAIIALPLDAIGIFVAFSPPTPIDPNAPKVLQDLTKMTNDSRGIGTALLNAGLALAALVTIIGSIQMIRKKTWALCLVGTILSMINIGNCCCVLGLPFGIWALILLLNPNVKDSFS